MKKLVLVLFMLVVGVMGVSAQADSADNESRTIPDCCSKKPQDSRFGVGMLLAKGQPWKFQSIIRLGKCLSIEDRISTSYFGSHPNDVFHREIENEIRMRCVWYRMQTCPMRLYSAAGILLWFDFEADDSFVERINPDDGYGSWTATWFGIEAFPTERLPLAIVVEANSTQKADFYMSLGLTFYLKK